MANQKGDTVSNGVYYNVCTDAANGTFDTKSFWGEAKDTEFEDGMNAETKVGAIKGITSDLNTTTTGYAADMTTVAKINSSLGGLSFGKDGDGNCGYYGADGSLIPFKQSKRFVVGTYGAANKTYDIKTVLEKNGVDYTQLTSDDFFIKNCNVQAYSNLQILETNVGISYNSENGTLTLTGMYVSGTNISIWMNVTIWVCL